jgi:NAD(P)H dehydrogenase (quinone)
MKETLIIYSHPNHTGFCGTYLKEIEKILKKEKQEYELIDLYKIKYNPILSNNEHYTSGNYHKAKDTLVFQEKIKHAKKLIFIYPTWWQTLPAILKGFIDRVFVSHFAFKYENGFPRGLLKNKKAIVFTSAGGPRLYSRVILCDKALRVMTKDILNFCGIKSKGFPIGSATKLTPKKIEEIKKTAIRSMKYLLA